MRRSSGKCFDHAAPRGVRAGRERRRLAQTSTLPILPARPRCAPPVSGQEACARLLVERGADVDQADTDSMTPLHIACQKGHEECARLQVEGGADINQANNNGEPPLYTACRKSRQACARLLTESGADIRAACFYAWTELHILCAVGDVKKVQSLVEGGVDVNQADDDDGTTPLHVACANGHAACVRLLLESGAAVNLADISGESPLITACGRGHEACVRLLIEGGADINQAQGGNNLATPVWIACWNKHAVCAAAGAGWRRLGLGRLLRCHAAGFLNREGRWSMRVAAGGGRRRCQQGLGWWHFATVDRSH